MSDVIDRTPKTSPLCEKFVLIGPIEAIVKSGGMMCFQEQDDIHIITQENDCPGLETFALRLPAWNWNLELERGYIVGFLRPQDCWLMGNLYEELDIKKQEIYSRAITSSFKYLNREGEFENRQKIMILLPLSTEKKILYVTQVCDKMGYRFQMLSKCPWVGIRD